MTDVSEIVSRRFGPKYERKCEHAETIECALWECQSAGVCRHSQRVRMADILRRQAERPRGIRPARRKEPRE